MPSGAKKRKAAKKKKEIHPPNPSSSAATRTNDGDDVKPHDDKESDVGEVTSPASQDPHCHLNPLTEGEEEEYKEGVVQVKREIKIEDETDKKNGEMEHDEPARNSFDGGLSESTGSSNSSSSSSDDESHDIKINQAVEDISTAVDSVKAVESLSGATDEAVSSAEIEESGKSVVEDFPALDSEMIEASEIHTTTLVDMPVAWDAVESLSKENGEEKPSAVEGQIGGSLPVVNEEGTFQSDENTAQELDLKVVEPNVDDGAEHEKDSGITQPLLAPVPHAVQSTSWKSCCGLFEFFSGSDR